MSRKWVQVLSAGAGITGLLAAIGDVSPLSRRQATAEATAIAHLEAAPLAFEPNVGQTDAAARFIARGKGYALWITDEGPVFRLHRPGSEQAPVVRMTMIDGRTPERIAPQRQLPGRSNYFIGNEPSRWRSNVARYESVRYDEVYPGIDLDLYGTQTSLEYDFIVAPGASPDDIAVAFEGAAALQLEDDGDLTLSVGGGALRFHKPLVYQERNGERVEIASRYRVSGTTLGFEVGGYDRSLPLVIDPVLDYSSYIGGHLNNNGTPNAQDEAQDVAIDADGKIYLTGFTTAINFPVTPGAFDLGCAGCFASGGDAFVIKIDPTQSGAASLVYGTYLGGQLNGVVGQSLQVGSSNGNGIAVDHLGQAHVTGGTGGFNNSSTPVNEAFPTTPNALQQNDGGDLAVMDAFYTKLSADGATLLYSTYLGGSNVDEGHSVVVDGLGVAYITGRSASANFPALTATGYQTINKGIFDAFVVKIDTLQLNAASLLYGTLFGGGANETGDAIAIDSLGRVYITGDAQFSNPPLPIVNGYLSAPGNGRKAYMAQFDPAQSGAASLLYSTYIGGSGTLNDTKYDGGIAVDADGIVYVMGTNNGGAFPTTPGAYQSVVQSNDVFIVKLDPSLAGASSFLAASLLGGIASEGGKDLAIDATGNPVIAGWTLSNNFAVTACGLTKENSTDAFITVMNPDLSGLLYSSIVSGDGADFGYAGAVGPNGEIYLAGRTDSTNFPTTPNALKPDHTSQCNGCGFTDAFVSRISMPTEQCLAAPTAANQTINVTEDTPKVLTLTATDTGGNSAPPETLTWTVTQLPTKGALDATSGTMTHTVGSGYTVDVLYTPNLNNTTPDSFKFIVNDGGLDSNLATITLNIAQVNDPPTANDQSVTTPEDTPKTITLSGTDIENNINAFEILSGPSFGTLAPHTAFTRIYTPNLNFTGTDSFTFRAKDFFGAVSAPATVTITVTPGNDPPQAIADAVTTPEDNPITIPVLANDLEPDGETLVITVLTQPANGTTVNNGNGTVTYTPFLNFNGTNAFSYTISDGTSTSTAMVTVTVSPVNDNPIAIDDFVITPEDTPLDIAVLGNDSDQDGNATMTVSAVTQGAKGSVTINANGTVNYSPNANVNGTDTFTYTASDGTASSTATVHVTITPVNDPPAVADDSGSTAEDVPVAIPVLANDSDADGVPLAVLVVTHGAHGVVTNNGDGTVTYAPAPNFYGADMFTYTVHDGTGDTATASVHVTVTPVNDAPNALDDTASTPEDIAVVVAVLGNDSDADNDALTISAAWCAVGGITANADGTLTYTPPANFHGQVACTYTASDNNGGDQAADLLVTVMPVNDAPVAQPDTASTSDAASVVIDVLANDVDPDGETVFLDNAGACQQGELIANADGTVTYTPDANFSGIDVCSYTIEDGHGGSAGSTVAITVTAINAPPSINDPGDQTSQQGQPVSLQLAGSDPDGDLLTFTADGLPPGLTITTAGLITGVPPAADSYQVTATVDDGQGGQASVSFWWTITAPTGDNTPPVCSAAGPSLGEIWPPNHKLVIPISVVGVTDADGDAIGITITGIFQDEPTNTLGDGSTWIDGFGVGTSLAQVRAERTGTPKVPGDGRVYEIRFAASDGRGGQCTGAVTVGVPHDKGKGPAKDSGVRYDSTVAGGGVVF